MPIRCRVYAATFLSLLIASRVFADAPTTAPADLPVTQKIIEAPAVQSVEIYHLVEKVHDLAHVDIFVDWTDLEHLAIPMDFSVTLSARKVNAVDYLTAAFDLAADGTEKGKASIQDVDGILVIARPATVKTLAQSIGKPGRKDPRIPKLDLPKTSAGEAFDAVRKASSLKDKTDWDSLAKVGVDKDREIRKISLGSVRVKTALVLLAESMADDDVTVESHLDADSFWFTAKSMKKE